MSYARLGKDSDVYVYESETALTCQWCALKFNGQNFTGTREEMIAHLLEHMGAGHLVPKHTLDALREEAAG